VPTLLKGIKLSSATMCNIPLYCTLKLKTFFNTFKKIIEGMPMPEKICPKIWMSTYAYLV
jgi:hypothetical protein